MGRTLFERLHGLYGDDVSQMLTVQYRMHEDIMSWASAALYHNLLTAHPSVAHHTLSDLPVSSMLQSSMLPHVVQPVWCKLAVCLPSKACWSAADGQSSCWYSASSMYCSHRNASSVEFLGISTHALSMHARAIVRSMPCKLQLEDGFSVLDCECFARSRHSKVAFASLDLSFCL